MVIRAMVIRAGRAGDGAAVLDLWNAADAIPGATDDIAAIEALLAHDPEALLLAEIDGCIVGSLIAAWDGWRGNMYRLAVLTAFRRKGVATALARAGEARLRTVGCRRITALVAGEHDHATAFWTSAGYEWQIDMRRYRS